MGVDLEKDTASVSSAIPAKTKVEFYDPSKESRLTRLGLTFESFKRAPGTTGGQVVAGANNVSNLDRVLEDSPMLQQKMKPRHLTMVAVGEYPMLRLLGLHLILFGSV